ncbi:hypothetical protein G6F32_016046 [Rhizopus arrhizus]|uniref:Uncharacterized protein n=1 Tax=Rhizopus delemar TaxID=936053 RepID=A0A9P7BZ43_9FUNG|nr:hypothetical protein G6F32_016046 [Rhizopus arrhizus]KAG1528755.1 hypothetical protein G6F50_018215 [Rhizopus delemar]
MRGRLTTRGAASSVARAGDETRDTERSRCSWPRAKRCSTRRCSSDSTVRITRYQTVATISNGTTSRLRR